MTTTPPTPTFAGAVLREHTYRDGYGRDHCARPFFTVECPPCGSVLNSGHHYTAEHKHHAQALADEHNAKHHPPAPAAPAPIDSALAWLRSGVATALRLPLVVSADAALADPLRTGALVQDAARAGVPLVIVPAGTIDPRLATRIAAALRPPAEPEQTPPPICSSCGASFPSMVELGAHLRDPGDVTWRPEHTCPVLWDARSSRRLERDRIAAQSSDASRPARLAVFDRWDKSTPLTEDGAR
jgi:hypothetical protein